MLHAILHGKAGRVADESGEQRSWRNLFQKREDLLTAVFFGRLGYLSGEAVSNVLSLLVGKALADKLGPLREVIFWPKLRGLEGRSHVEPDVLLLFEKTLLMIEVKPPFGGDQSEVQWRAQVESLIKQRDLSDASLDVPDEFHFLALGRNAVGYKEAAERLHDAFHDEGLETVHTHQWAEICYAVHELSDAAQGRDYAVYADWIEAFQLFGMIERPLPFDDLLPQAKTLYREGLRILQEFNVQQVSRTLPKVDWLPLAEMAKGMALKPEMMK